MDWLKRMKDAVDYMEEHMEEPFDVSVAAKVALSSTFHFQRMFHMLTGNAVAEYVRKRKLTLAAQELSTSKAKVIDIAFKYGYDTPESFSKAFRRLHGISPSAAREPGANLKAIPRISFHLSLKGDKDMDYKVIEKEAFQVVGKSIEVSTKDGENFKNIPLFWKESCENGFTEKLEKISGTLGILGVCWNDYDGEKFTYIIAVEKPGECVQDTREYEIPASKWAVFESVGPMPDAIQNVIQRIYSEWFPSTGYEHADAPDLEVYYPGDASSDNYRCEVWIPITKK
ncbi:MAG: AraC family transcriptional regulator [Clostridia bacterium]|nr:AraC family transcriptional regulator [Clostridia bacterium]